MNSRWIVGSLLFFAAFLIYLHGAYPSVSPGDSGEFITAARTLGIPHAPGYATYTLLGGCLDRLIPWANHGYRMNLFSAVCGALTVSLIYFLALQLAFSIEGCAFVAIWLMILPAFRLNAQASEVFALHSLFVVAILVATMTDRWLLAAFLMGIGVANHQTLVLLVPAVSLAYLARRSRAPAPWPPILAAILLGFSIHFFLWIRAGQGPLLNSGDPDTWPRFWRVLTRADYGSLTLALGDSPARTPEFTIQQFTRFLQGLAGQITWFGVVGVLAGAWVWIRRQFVPAYTLVVAFLFLGPVFFLMGNLPFDAQSNGLLDRFYIAPAMCGILLLTGGLESFRPVLGKLSRVFFIVPLFIAFTETQADTLRQDYRAYAYGRNNLRTLPPRVDLIIDGGDDTFYTLAYLTRVEHRRPDVGLHDRGGVVYPGYYGPDFRQLSRVEKETRRWQVERSQIDQGRTLYYSTMNEHVLPKSPLEQQGILYKPSSQSSGRTDPWPFYDLRGVRPWSAGPSADYRTRALLPFYAYQRAVQEARAKNWATALQFAWTAYSVGPDVVWLIPNLMHNGFAWAQETFDAGHLEITANLYAAMTHWDPGSSIAWMDLGAIEEKQNHLDTAIRHYQRAIELDPSSEAAHFNLAVAYWKRSDWSQVIDELNQVLSINPTNASARQYLDQAQARALTAAH